MSKPTKLNFSQLCRLREYHARRFSMSGAFAILSSSALNDKTFLLVKKLEVLMTKENKNHYIKQKKLNQ